MLKSISKDRLKTIRIRGGIIALLGVPLLIVSLAALGNYRWYQVLFCGVGIASIISGVTLYAHDNFGNNRFVSKKRGPASKRPAHVLREVCQMHNYPYTICLYHRKVVSDSLYAGDDDRWQEDECALCNPLLDYIQIADNDDLALALTSLEDTSS